MEHAAMMLCGTQTVQDTAICGGDGVLADRAKKEAG